MIHKEKNNYLLKIILLFITITIVPISIFILTKNEYFFSFSLIPIVIFFLIFFKLQITSKINLTWGIITIFYPLIILSIHGISVFLFDKNAKINFYFIKSSNFITTFFITLIVILFTEEALFRGIFWFLFDKTGYSIFKKNFFISILFTLWHIPIIILFPEFHIKLYIVPIYFFNIFLLSFNFGFLRYFSNSIILISICHALWNALVYDFFGYGKITGSWKVGNYLLFDPERGLIGILLQIIVLGVFLYKIYMKLKINKLFNSIY